jgi:predicted membrane-bound spermidine synthase
MGMSLPLLVRAVTRSIASGAHHSGMLYALNTLGAASGALVATWILLPSLGLASSLSVAAALNALAAVVGAILIPRLPERRDLRETGPPAAGSTTTGGCGSGRSITHASTPTRRRRTPSTS